MGVIHEVLTLKWVCHFITSLCTIRRLLAATLETLKSSRLIEVGRLTEVQNKLDRKGSKYDFIASIWQNLF